MEDDLLGLSMVWGCDSLKRIKTPTISGIRERDFALPEFSSHDSVNGWYRNDLECARCYSYVRLENTSILLTKDKPASPEYTITYDLRGGINNIYNPTYYLKGKSVTFKAPTKKNYTFAGWYDACTDKKVTSVSGKNISVYAKWTPTKYTITFNLNNGTFPKGTVKPASYNIESSEIFLPTPTRTYYHFMGWYEDKQFTKPATSIPAGSYGNKTFYAKWEGNEYRISYDLKGGSNHASNPSVFYGAGTVTFKNPTRDGYTFAGWYDADTNKKVTSVKGKDISVYAKWTVKKYTVTFNLNLGTFPKGTVKPANYTIENSTIVLPTPTRQYYHFMGWYEDKQFTKPVTSIPAGSFGNKTFYAKWEGQKYTFTFHSNNEQNLSETQTFLYGTKTKLYSANDMDMFRYGYKFGGWTATVNGRKKTFKDKQDMLNYTKVEGENLDLYADWQEITYTIVYHANGGKGSVKNTTVKGISSVALRNNTFKKTGYTADGWVDQYGRKYADGQEVKELTGVDKVCITMYANWKEDSYTIRYDANGGTLKNGQSAPETTTAGYATPVYLPACPYEKTGFVFRGWNTKANGTGKNFSASSWVLIAELGGTGTITLYPKWESQTDNTLTITYEAGTGKGTAMAKTVMKSSANLAACTYTKPGYKFDGWKVVDGKLSKNTYANKEKIVWDNSYKGKAVTLEAQWTPVSYTITFDANTGTNSGAVVKVYYYTDEIQVSSLGFTHPDGLAFAGWNTRADGKGQSYSKGSSRTVDEIFGKDKTSIILYMQWDLRKANMYHLKQLYEEGKLTQFTVDGTDECAKRHGRKCPSCGNDHADGCCNCELIKIADKDWFINDILGMTREEYNQKGGKNTLCKHIVLGRGNIKSCVGFGYFAQWYAVTGGDLTKTFKDTKVTYRDFDKLAESVKPGDYIWNREDLNQNGHAMTVVDSYKRKDENNNEHWVIEIIESNGMAKHKNESKIFCAVQVREITQMNYKGSTKDEEGYQKFRSAFGSDVVLVRHITE